MFSPLLTLMVVFAAFSSFVSGFFGRLFSSEDGDCLRVLSWRVSNKKMIMSREFNIIIFHVEFTLVDDSWLG